MWMTTNQDLQNLEVVTAETLNGKVEFDSPFRIVGQLHDGRTVIENPLSDVYAPSVVLYTDKDHNGVGEEEIDNVEWNKPQKTWEVVNGYSGQYGYSGPTMHASEFLGGGMARDVLEDVGAVYVLSAVECLPDWEVDEDDEDDVFLGQVIQDNPAGWMLLKLKDSAE